MKKFEYIQLGLDFGDLDKLNRLSGLGWHVVYVYEVNFFNLSHGAFPFLALLEREIPE